MFTEEALTRLRQAISDCTTRDARLLDQLRREVGKLKSEVRVIKERQTTSVAMVASDGGNNRLTYDPFLIQLVRVVDSLGKELCLEAVSPTSDTDALSAQQFDAAGEPVTALGRLMRDVDVTDRRIYKLAYGSIPTPAEVAADPVAHGSPGWVQTYRDIWEWATLYDRVVYHTFATDTLLVRDGLLRSKFIRPPYFTRMIAKMQEAVTRIEREDRRRVYLVGLAKHSLVIERYRLAMTIENVLPDGAPRFVVVPRDMEIAAYGWAEWVTDPNFSAGQLHLVRFGSRDGDPIWAVDILKGQESRAGEILGYLMTDARDGFPIPFYPRCLQLAHEHAEVADWDLGLFQDTLIDAVRALVPEARRDAVDAHRLLPDMTGRRFA